MADLTPPRRPRVRARALLALALVWLTLTGGVFSGCRGLFTPAIPEPPSGRPIVVDYRSPDATLRTMAQGIQAKGQGASAWLGAFADSSRPEDGPGYHQFFDPNDLAFFQSACGCEAPTSWRNSQEQAFFLEFIGVRPSDDYAILFEEIEQEPDPPAEDALAVLHRRYRVLATSPDGNSTRIIAIGLVSLTVSKIAADRWLITRWQDRVDPAVGVNPTDPDQLSLGRRRLESTR